MPQATFLLLYITTLIKLWRQTWTALKSLIQEQQYFIFHTVINKNLFNKCQPTNNSIQPSLFLSKLLITTEKNHQCTELGIANFVWVIKKVRHLINSSRAQVIIQTDHLAILDILQQFSIKPMVFTMRLNLWLVKVSQFLQQSKLSIWHKRGNKYIIFDILNRLANTIGGPINPFYIMFDIFFVYNTTLVEIHPTLVMGIFTGYNTDAWWSWFQHQVYTNEDLGQNKALLLLVADAATPSNADPYLAPRLEENTQVPLQPKGPEVPQPSVTPKKDLPLLQLNRLKLLHHINRIIGIQHLCILSSMALDLLAIAHKN